MYIPTSFAEPNLNKLHDFMEAHSFGILLTQNANLEASHLPFLLERERGKQGTIIGHMARANGQWRDADGRPALAVFRGPHAYISPSWYGADNVVPTWNYVAVHAHGTLRLIHDDERLLQIVTDAVTQYEAPRTQPWTLDGVDDAFIDGLLGAIVGFELQIENLEGKWKLSQNHDTERRQRVVDGLQAEGGADAHAVAALMQATLDTRRDSQ